jgi:hypothetical protein
VMFRFKELLVRKCQVDRARPLGRAWQDAGRRGG